MDDLLFELLVLLIPVMCFILTGFLIPYIRTKISSEKLSTIVNWVEKAVKCAEIIFPDSNMGSSKKEYVINLIDKMFNSKKTVITIEQIEILIESAVQEMNSSNK